MTDPTSLTITIPLDSIEQAHRAITTLGVAAELALRILAKAAAYSEEEVLQGVDEVFSALQRCAGGGPALAGMLN